MRIATQTTIFSLEVSGSGWAKAIDRIIYETESAEHGLASLGAGTTYDQRKSSGSYYTPADVAAHFWNLFFRHHAITDAGALRELIARTDFVEPSAGSGIFVFTFLRKALALGLAPHEAARVRFHVIDINFSALRFFSTKLHELEGALGVTFNFIGTAQRDFLDWAAAMKLENVTFVGNPPFVSNERGSKWRNLFANFLEAMLRYPSAHKAISLILPVSVCFSRDYVDLRRLISSTGLGISASSYDNIPDCLFKSGKPESTNSNRANSQRCTILNLGGPDPECREAAPLQRWAVRERGRLLEEIPIFQDYRNYSFDHQIPRPDSARVMAYLARSSGAPSLGVLLSRNAEARFALAGVARNFIGIRDVSDGKHGSIAIRPSSDENMLVLVQIFASKLFYEYWRTLGDGFHVTKDLVERFPVSFELRSLCVSQLSVARRAWEGRGCYAKEKLNSGQMVRSYDFSNAFEHLRH